MLKANRRLVVFTVTVIALLIASNFLPASAQLSQWRSLNPTRDGAFLSRTAPAPFLYGVQMLTPNYGWAVGGTCEIYTDVEDPDYRDYPCSQWANGDGLALFWDGARWRQTLVPASTRTLTSVFIVAANDVWAVGMRTSGVAPTIIHWDGISWVAATPPPLTTGVDLYSVFMLPGGLDGWAVGYDNNVARAAILRWSGTWPTGAWSVFATIAPAAPPQVLRGVFLSSPTQGWAVGESGTILRWDGAGWTVTSSPTTRNLYSVFALSPTDAWAVGAFDTIIRWNGASWTGPMIAPTTGVHYRSIRMVNAADGWIAGRLNPTSQEGTLLRWNGAAWSIVRSFVTVDLNGLFMLPGGGVGSAVGDAETIIHWDSSIWFARTSPTSTDLNAVSMVASNDGWAVGDEGRIFRYNGLAWSHYETLPSRVNLHGLHMRASADGWAVGAPLPMTDPSGLPFPPTILRWNGAAWTSVTPSGVALGRTLYAVDMLSATESWAVGDGTTNTAATMLKWDGALWTSVPSGTPVNQPSAGVYSRLYSIDMLSSTDGWAVGCATPPTCATPVIVRWNGIAWSQVTAPSVAGLYDVFMLSPTDGWAVGNATGTQATIIHWDGIQWRSVPGPAVAADGFLDSVHMVSPTDGWAVGWYGTASFPDGSATRSLIVHWDGLTWNVVSTLPLPPTMAVRLRSVFMVAALDGWIVSDQGLILKYGPEIVPGTTTTTSTTTETTTATTSETTTTTTPPPEWRIPGFPIESILAGLVAGVAVLAVLRHRPRRRP